MMTFNGSVQARILDLALKLKGYSDICAGVLQITDASEYPDATKQAIGRLGERMATYNSGRPEAATILHTVATVAWEDAGINNVPALTTADRETIIGVIMAVSKQVILAEANRLELLADSDTALPQGWNV